jgi:glucose-6-phosphate isomerase
MSLSLDLNLLTRSHVGPGGLSRADFEATRGPLSQAHAWLRDGRRNGTIAFMELPSDRASIEAAKQVGANLRDYENVVVLGIGGSSLGAKALFGALCHPFHNLLPKEARTGARVFFPDNADSRTFTSLMAMLDLSRTAFVAITKSGSTAETWAQLLWVLKRLGPDLSKRNVFAVTDPSKGALRELATKEGWPTLPVPPAVGGRFSVLTAVGLLPAVAAGIDVEALLQGAKAMAHRCENDELFLNPASLLATALFLMDRKCQRNIHVLMPYADALRDTSDWFIQLWAESLGKKTPNGPVGPTPLRAVGATDQHSMLQLLMEGPEDKCVMFVAADTSRQDFEIPSMPHASNEVSYLSGHTLHELLLAEQRSTAAALASNGRPSMTFRLPQIDEFHMGELLMLFEVATALAGPLYGVNPFDQPGVEAGKRYTCGMLGRPGYEAAKRELESMPSPDLSWVV